jgi:hypothetical protein
VEEFEFDDGNEIRLVVGESEWGETLEGKRLRMWPELPVLQSAGGIPRI